MDHSSHALKKLITNKPSVAGQLVCLAVLVGVTLYTYVISYQLSHQFNQHIGTQVVLQYTVCFAGMFWFWWLTPQRPSTTFIWFVLTVAVLLRLSLIPITPYTSNDVSRYLFDGRVLLTGLDPYITPHLHPALDHLRAIWQPPVEHIKYPTLYPPLALWMYSLAASFDPENALLVWKIMTGVASTLTLFVGALILNHLGKLNALSLLAFNPLLILEAGEAAHVDAFTTLCIALAIYGYLHCKYCWAGIALGLGAAIKLLPIMLVLPLFFFITGYRHKQSFVMGAVLGLGLVYAIALANNLQAIGMIGTFFEKWRVNSPLFHWFEPVLGSQAIYLLVVLLGLTATGIISYLSYQHHLSDNQIRLTGRHYLLLQGAIAVPILLSPVVFAWYLMPLAFLFALKPNWPVALWMISISLSYEVLNLWLSIGQWQPTAWVTHLIGASLLLGIIIAYFDNHNKRFRF